jgi:predicted aldo/keto reductase-like oxidoreductase
MLYRRLGRTGLKLSVLSIGGSIFGPWSGITLAKAREIVSSSVENGINFIDIAKEYDEEFISKVLGNYKKKIIISVRSNADDEKSMTRDIKDSIKKLHIRPIPIYQTSVVSLDNRAIDALEKAKKDGLINYIGIFGHKGNFNHNIKVLDDAIKTGKFDVVEILYNIVHRMAERLFKYTEKYDVGFLAAAPFASGILIYPSCKKGNKEEMSSRALRFLISNRNITSAVIGSSNPFHILENIRSMDVIAKKGRLSNSERYGLIEETEDFFRKNFCRMCRYCECPKGIQILDILKLLIIFEIYGCKDQAREAYSRQAIKFNACNACGACEKNCPYNLPIIKMLEKADKILS